MRQQSSAPLGPCVRRGGASVLQTLRISRNTNTGQYEERAEQRFKNVYETLQTRAQREWSSPGTASLRILELLSQSAKSFSLPCSIKLRSPQFYIFFLSHPGSAVLLELVAE
jgi:hypothetical protein